MPREPKCINRKEGLLLLDYEQGRMTAEAARAFEQNHLAHCAACRENLAFFQPIWERLRARPELLTEAEELARQRASWRVALSLKWPLAAAAAIALVLVLGTIVRLYYTGPKKLDYAALATLEEVDPVRWRGGASDDLLMRAIEVYQEEHYAEAVEELKKVIEGDPAEPRAYLYLGLSYLRLGENKEAVKALRMSVDKSDGLLKERSRWNLANTYLRLGDGQQSRKELAALIKESSSPYKAQAEELLRKIEHLERAK